MPDTELRITLPDEAEMLRRLKEVNDDEYMVDRLFPLIAKHAGREKVPAGVVNMLTMAIAEYASGMPASVMYTAMLFTPRFIDALIDDDEFRQATQDFYKETVLSS